MLYLIRQNTLSKDGIINIKNVGPNNIKINEKLYNDILIYCIGYRTPNSVWPVHPIINNTKGYIEESNENKYLTLIPTDERKDNLKWYLEIWSKIKDLI